METDPVDTLAQAVKSARRAVALALIAVAVSIVVLAIDNGIKRAIVDEAQDVRRVVDDFKKLVRESVVAANGTGTGPDPASSGAGPDSTGHVDDASRTPAAPDPHADGAPVPAAKRAGRPRGGTRGNGQ